MISAARVCAVLATVNLVCKCAQCYQVFTVCTGARIVSTGYNCAQVFTVGTVCAVFAVRWRARWLQRVRRNG